MPWCSSVGVEGEDRRLLAAVLRGRCSRTRCRPCRRARPCAQSPPVASRNWRIWPHMLPKRVGVPKMIASACARSSMVQTGTAACSRCAFVAPSSRAPARAASRGRGAARPRRPSTSRTPSATACAMPVDVPVHRVVGDEHLHRGPLSLGVRPVFEARGARRRRPAARARRTRPASNPSAGARFPRGARAPAGRPARLQLLERAHDLALVPRRHQHARGVAMDKGLGELLVDLQILEVVVGRSDEGDEDVRGPAVETVELDPRRAAGERDDELARFARAHVRNRHSVRETRGRLLLATDQIAPQAIRAPDAAGGRDHLGQLTEHGLLDRPGEALAIIGLLRRRRHRRPQLHADELGPEHASQDHGRPLRV